MIQHELAVVGLGPLGSHALRAAARRGVDAIGLELHPAPGHEHGAAAGWTRIFRLAYKEGPEWVPALRESLDVWRDLAACAPEPLLHPCGTLTIGAPEHPDLATTVAAARASGVEIEVVPAGPAGERWPQHRFGPGEIGILDPAGALLRAPAAVRAAVDDARRHGATVATGSAVTATATEPGGVLLHRADGGTVRARRVLVTVGAWLGALLPALAGEVELRRAVSHWFAPAGDPAATAPERFPVGLRRSGGDGDLSFFPAVDDRGVKVNLHARKQVVRHAERDRLRIEDALSGRVAASVRAHLPGLDPRPRHREPYVESYTPDLRPLLGPAPGLPGVWVLGGGSGQAFKSSPALGRIAVDLVLGDAPRPTDRPLTRSPARGASDRPPSVSLREDHT